MKISRRSLATIAAVSSTMTSMLTSTACLPGVEQLQDGATLEVLVTGVDPAQRLTVEVAALSYTRVVADDEASVRFYLTVPAGRHDGRVRLVGADGIDSNGDDTCMPFRARVDSDVRSVVGVDMALATSCTAPTVPRQLISLEELVFGDCADGGDDCTVLTSFSADGEVVVEQSEGPSARGQGRGIDADALVEEALSSDADVLFSAVGCGQLGGPPREVVELTRSIDDDGDERAFTVDVGNCRSGIAARLRARLAILRDDVLSD
ncbi:MAG TPA: hypothetical protein VGF99_21585 [Myxococcota bacterium]